MHWALNNKQKSCFKKKSRILSDVLFCEVQILCKYVGSKIFVSDGQTELLHQTYYTLSSVSNLILETILP